MATITKKRSLTKLTFSSGYPFTCLEIDGGVKILNFFIPSLFNENSDSVSGHRLNTSEEKLRLITLLFVLDLFKDLKLGSKIDRVARYEFKDPRTGEIRPKVELLVEYCFKDPMGFLPVSEQLEQINYCTWKTFELFNEMSGKQIFFLQKDNNNRESVMFFNEVSRKNQPVDRFKPDALVEFLQKYENNPDRSAPIPQNTLDAFKFIVCYFSDLQDAGLNPYFIHTALEEFKTREDAETWMEDPNCPKVVKTLRKGYTIVRDRITRIVKIVDMFAFFKDSNFAGFKLHYLVFDPLLDPNKVIQYALDRNINELKDVLESNMKTNSDLFGHTKTTQEIRNERAIKDIFSSLNRTSFQKKRPSSSSNRGRSRGSVQPVVEALEQLEEDEEDEEDEETIERQKLRQASIPMCNYLRNNLKLNSPEDYGKVVCNTQELYSIVVKTLKGMNSNNSQDANRTNFDQVPSTITEDNVLHYENWADIHEQADVMRSYGVCEQQINQANYLSKIFSPLYDEEREDEAFLDEELNQQQQEEILQAHPNVVRINQEAEEDQSVESVHHPIEQDNMQMTDENHDDNQGSQERIQPARALRRVTRRMFHYERNIYKAPYPLACWRVSVKNYNSNIAWNSVHFPWKISKFDICARLTFEHYLFHKIKATIIKKTNQFQLNKNPSRDKPLFEEDEERSNDESSNEESDEDDYSASETIEENSKMLSKMMASVFTTHHQFKHVSIYDMFSSNKLSTLMNMMRNEAQNASANNSADTGLGCAYKETTHEDLCSIMQRNNEGLTYTKMFLPESETSVSMIDSRNRSFRLEEIEHGGVQKLYDTLGDIASENSERKAQVRELLDSLQQEEHQEREICLEFQKIHIDPSDDQTILSEFRSMEPNDSNQMVDSSGFSNYTTQLSKCFLEELDANKIKSFIMQYEAEKQQELLSRNTKQVPQQLSEFEVDNLYELCSVGEENDKDLASAAVASHSETFKYSKVIASAVDEFDNLSDVMKERYDLLKIFESIQHLPGVKEMYPLLQEAYEEESISAFSSIFYSGESTISDSMKVIIQYACKLDTLVAPIRVTSSGTDLFSCTKNCIIEMLHQNDMQRPIMTHQVLDLALGSYMGVKRICDELGSQIPPNVIFLGPFGTGKSFIFDMIKKVLISRTCNSMDGCSTYSMTSGQIFSCEVVIQHEGSSVIANKRSKTTSNDVIQEMFMKLEMTQQYVTRSYLQLSKDGQRRTVTTNTPCSRTRFVASNTAYGLVQSPSLWSRYIVWCVDKINIEPTKPYEDPSDKYQNRQKIGTYHTMETYLRRRQVFVAIFSQMLSSRAIIYYPNIEIFDRLWEMAKTYIKTMFPLIVKEARMVDKMRTSARIQAMIAAYDTLFVFPQVSPFIKNTFDLDLSQENLVEQSSSPTIGLKRSSQSIVNEDDQEEELFGNERDSASTQQQRHQSRAFFNSKNKRKSPPHNLSDRLNSTGIMDYSDTARSSTSNDEFHLYRQDMLKRGSTEYLDQFIKTGSTSGVKGIQPHQKSKLEITKAVLEHQKTNRNAVSKVRFSESYEPFSLKQVQKASMFAVTPLSSAIRILVTQLEEEFHVDLHRVFLKYLCSLSYKIPAPLDHTDEMIANAFSKEKNKAYFDYWTPERVLTYGASKVDLNASYIPVDESHPFHQRGNPKSLEYLKMFASKEIGGIMCYDLNWVEIHASGISQFNQMSQSSVSDMFDSHTIYFMMKKAQTTQMTYIKKPYVFNPNMWDRADEDEKREALNIYRKKFNSDPSKNEQVCRNIWKIKKKKSKTNPSEEIYKMRILTAFLETHPESIIKNILDRITQNMVVEPQKIPLFSPIHNRNYIPKEYHLNPLTDFKTDLKKRERTFTANRNSKRTKPSRKSKASSTTFSSDNKENLFVKSFDPSCVELKLRANQEYVYALDDEQIIYTMNFMKHGVNDPNRLGCLLNYTPRIIREKLHPVADDPIISQFPKENFAQERVEYEQMIIERFQERSKINHSKRTARKNQTSPSYSDSQNSPSDTNIEEQEGQDERVETQDILFNSVTNYAHLRLMDKIHISPSLQPYETQQNNPLISSIHNSHTSSSNQQMSNSFAPSPPSRNRSDPVNFSEHPLSDDSDLSDEDLMEEDNSSEHSPTSVENNHTTSPYTNSTSNDSSEMYSYSRSLAQRHTRRSRNTRSLFD